LTIKKNKHKADPKTEYFKENEWKLKTLIKQKHKKSKLKKSTVNKKNPPK